MSDHLVLILSYINLFRNWEPAINFTFTSLIVIIVLTLYLKSPVKEREMEKHFYFFSYWIDLLILILIPLLLYIKLADAYDKDNQWGPIILGFVLSFIFIFYVELDSRSKKIRLFYFFILACSSASLLGFLDVLLEFINI
ncbi:hypothetical protein [Leptospira stimsonii]|uniref:Uncharacterized protein n=1 Tax=Leptospira stimsonii TaxID=2202203 RepID=A0A396ZGB0_9LEPT|nr:hypothetical protein DLM75_02940 [Leptospira stimsonii]